MATHCTHSLRSPTRAHAFMFAPFRGFSPHPHRSARARTSHNSLLRSPTNIYSPTHTCPLYHRPHVYTGCTVLSVLSVSHTSLHFFTRLTHLSLRLSGSLSLLLLFFVYSRLYSASPSLSSLPSPSRSPSNGLALRRLSKGGDGCEERREKDRRLQRGAQEAGQEGKGTL